MGWLVPLLKPTMDPVDTVVVDMVDTVVDMVADTDMAVTDMGDTVASDLPLPKLIPMLKPNFTVMTVDTEGMAVDTEGMAVDTEVMVDMADMDTMAEAQVEY